jgi:hypothetical protein
MTHSEKTVKYFRVFFHVFSRKNQKIEKKIQYVPRRALIRKIARRNPPRETALSRSKLDFRRTLSSIAMRRTKCQARCCGDPFNEAADPKGLLRFGDWRPPETVHA